MNNQGSQGSRGHGCQYLEWFSRERLGWTVCKPIPRRSTQASETEQVRVGGTGLLWWLSCRRKMKLLKIKGKIKIYFLQCTFGRLQKLGQILIFAFWYFCLLIGKLIGLHTSLGEIIFCELGKNQFICLPVDTWKVHHWNICFFKFMKCFRIQKIYVIHLIVIYSLYNCQIFVFCLIFLRTFVFVL